MERTKPEFSEHGVSPCFGSPKPDPIRRRETWGGRNMGAPSDGLRPTTGIFSLPSPSFFFFNLRPTLHPFLLLLPRARGFFKEEKRDISSHGFFVHRFLLSLKNRSFFIPVRAIIMPEYLLYLILVLLLLTSPSPSFLPDDRNLSQKLLILAEFLADLLLLELRVRARRLLPAPHCSLHTLHCLFDQRLRRIRILSIRLKPLLA